MTGRNGVGVSIWRTRDGKRGNSAVQDGRGYCRNANTRFSHDAKVEHGPIWSSFLAWWNIAYFETLFQPAVWGDS